MLFLRQRQSRVMGKVINHFIQLTFAGVFLFCQNMTGQDNPYKINDQLYPYYMKCSRMIRNEKVMLMADTLFQRAEQKGDLKAQCLALNLKADHYYFTENIQSLLKEHKVVSDFARKTPHQQYVFGSWNRIITYYLRHREYESALEELQKYQEEAIKLNNEYGIGQSYIKMGDVYFQQDMSSIALEQYLQAVSYYKSVGKDNELYHPYNQIGQCYTNLEQLDKAEDYILKALEKAPKFSAKMTSYLVLFRIFIRTDHLEKAKEIKDILCKYNPSEQFGEATKANYYNTTTTYYIATNELEKAQIYCDSINDNLIKIGLKSRIYAQMGEFEKAYVYRNRYIQLSDSLRQEKNNQLLASHNARFNNQKLELDKNRLTLLNTKMRLKQLEDRGHIVFMEKERTRIELENKNLQLEQQRTATELEKAETQKQRLEVIQKQEELQKTEREKADNKRKAFVIICILLLISGFSTIYAIIRRQHTKRLKIEKEAAEQARRQAEKADRLKSAFLQNMSHEIRTPLNAIVGFNDLLNDSTMKFETEERQELLSHLHTNTDLLLTLVNDVLDLSKLESGNYNITLTPVKVNEVCQATLAGVSHRVYEGVQLLLQQPDTGITITTDGQRLQQILTNLLVNACKYTTKGSITLAYEVDNGKVIFSVTDTGCGIAKDKSEVIFQRFEKLDSFKTGFGLGLSICRSLTQVLGGEIYLDTEYTGGARFIVAFPLERE